MASGSSTTQAPHGRPGAEPVSLRTLALPMAVGWALLAVSALAVGDFVGIARAGIVPALVLGAILAARWRPAGRAMAWALGTYAVALSVATVAASLVPSGLDDSSRQALFTGNPNDLGAALVVAGVAWLAVRGRSVRWVWLWPVLAFAVLYTGSRTSGGALFAALVVWLAVRVVRSRSRSSVALVLAGIVVAALAVGWQYGVVERSPNRLGAPNDLAGYDWRHDLAASVDVVDGAAAGPFEGTIAQRLVATARAEHRNLVFQSTGRSEQGVPYVASIYLRADAPQRLVLSSHVASTTCEVGTEWRRCVTPVGYGDDYTQAQFHLRASERGGGIDVFVYGAQYEIGDTASPFRDARPDWIPQSIVRRYDLRRLTAAPADRVAIWREGLSAASARPWFGVGLAASRDILVERTRQVLSRPVTYAHNLLVHLYLVHGIVGLVGAALVGGAAAYAAGRPDWGRIAPLLVALALLNTWDLTLFEPEVALPLVVGLAVAAAGRPRQWPGNGDRPVNDASSS